MSFIALNKSILTNINAVPYQMYFLPKVWFSGIDLQGTVEKQNLGFLGNFLGDTDVIGNLVLSVLVMH